MPARINATSSATTTENTGGSRVVAVTLDEVAGADGPPAPDQSSRLPALLAAGEPGEILATEVVRLLRATPECGVWDDRPVAGMPGVSRLRWEQLPDPPVISVVVAEWCRAPTRNPPPGPPLRTRRRSAG